jgi:outer membrane protein assembly factor BamB/tetratricopeptide (TPR) repeat protein
MRRAFAGLMVVAFVAALVLLPSDAARGQKTPVPVPPGGGPVPPGVPGAPGTQPGVNDLADKGRLTLPTDPKLKRKLEAVRDYVKSEDWDKVCTVAQELLDVDKDVFVQMPVKQPDGKEVDTLVGIRIAANRLLASLPRDKPGAGLDAYNQMHKVHAKELLTQATTDGDRQKFADVAFRYLWTDAGGDAAERLATILLDRGDFTAAALAFDRLIQRDGVEKLDPLTLYKAAIAFNRGNSKEDKENKEKVWKQLQTKAPDGLTIGGQTVALDDAAKYLDRIRGGVNTSVYDWPMVGGNPSRSGQGQGDTPFMQSRWRYSLFSGENSPVRKWIVGDDSTVIKRLSDKGEAVIPAFAPVTATVVGADGKPQTLVVYRDYDGVTAVDLKTGKRRWIARSHWSMEDMLRPGQGQKGASLNAWVQQFKDMHNKPGVLIENSTVGTLSSDGNRVYFIDDLQVPPYVQQQFNQPWGGIPQPGVGGVNQDVKPGVDANKLQAVSIASGKLFWELGGPRTVEGDGAGLKHDFKDSYFLGPPLALGGKLYFLNEQKEMIRLCCLDTGKLPAKDPQPKDLDDAIAWVQPLGTAKEKILADWGRRINATQIAYGEGILVCPTNAGVILGVDLLTHSLLWAHTYSDAPAPQPMNDPYAPFRGGRMPVQPQPNQPIVTDWKASPPIITDGKVIFTAPDGPELRCLNLRNGAQVWGLKRSDGDVYLAGVFAGRVVIVGKKDVRALSLDDARELWRIPTGMPSGRGVASGNVYYVPLKEAIFSDKEKGPGIYAIDVEHGKLIAQTRSKKAKEATTPEVPGNLTFFDGQVISQSATEVAAYPQLKVMLEQMNERLAKNPKDPEGLYTRGELRLDKGERAGAVEDLLAALDNSPSADLKVKAQTKLFDAMTELLQHDFADGEKYLKKYEELCTVTGGDDAARETQRRQANFLCLVAKGREEQGKLDEALKSYLKFGSLPTAQDELLSVVTEPAVKARPDVWARGRIKAMLDRATPDQRKPLEEVISTDWAGVKASGDLERLRHFVSMFGDTAAIGKEGQLFLAERLMERPGKADMLDAETQFLKLAQDEDDAFVARALDGLARLCTRKGELEDAYRYYESMKVRFPDKEVRDGKTGTQLFDELATDKRFLQYMDETVEAPAGKADAAPAPVKRKYASVMERDKNFNQQSQHSIFTFTPEGDPLPALKHLRIGMNPGTSHFKVVDRRDGKEQVSFQITENFNQFMYPTQNNMAGMMPGMVFPGNMTQPEPNHFSYHAVGHLVVANVGQWLIAVDAVTHRKLWDKNLLGEHGPGTGGLQYHAADETLQLMFPSGDMIGLAQGGPVQPGYVSLLTRDGLMALDPLTGKTLWIRSDVTARCRLFGDARHIYMVELNNDGTASTTRAFRAQDGASVPVPNFAALYQKKERVVGRQLVVADSQSTGLSLRLYDVHTGKDLWSEKFPVGSTVLHSEDPDLAGIITPDGRVNVMSVSRRKVVFKGIVDVEHMKNLRQAHLLADAKQIYVAFHTTDPTNPNNEAWENLQSNTGLRDIPVNGEVYAFDRRTARIKWHNAVNHQKLVLEQWREMPAMLFTSRYMQGGNNGMVIRGGMPNQQWGDVYIEAYDKQTGKLFYKMPTRNGEPQMGQQYALVYAVNYDAANGKVEMIANNYKLTISQEGEATSASAAAGGKEEKGAPKPAAGGASGQQGGSTDVLPRATAPQKKAVIINE